MPNRLAAETSPYLRQHADNPVDWYPWGPDALERARAEDRPILLSIGYSSCHWCHVMERESFEDPEVARLMNDSFVSVKVDREERPDVDQVYMKAVQVMTGHGGWPLTVFLTPAGEPFYGGTYFPPAPRHGLPSFRQVLHAAAEAFRVRRGDVERGASEILSVLRQTGAGKENGDVPVGPGGWDGAETLLDEATRAMARQYDPAHGGFGRAPKFPQPVTLEVLLRQHARTGESAPLDMAVTTLRRMAAGGIRDHLAGGFHRYSVDARWLVPHFEKMLYDNALLAVAYLDAWRATGLDELRDVAEDTLDWILADMRGPEGGFCAAWDADSEGVEGKFYVWSPAEVAAELGAEDAALFCRVHDVTEAGNFEGKNVLWLPHPVEVAARGAGVDPKAARERLSHARDRLRVARSRRPQPFRDEKVLSGWAALAIRALAEAGGALDRADYRDAAAAGADFVLGAMRREGRLLHVHKDGSARIGAFLEDYAALGNALVSLHESTLDPRWLDEARWCCVRVVEAFWDPAEGIFHDAATDAEPLVVRARDPMDNATPSGNSLAAELLARAAHLFGEGTYEEIVRRAVAREAAAMARYPTAFGRLLSVADRLDASPTEVAIVGDPADPATRALVAAALNGFHRNRTVAGGRPGALPAGVPLLEGRNPVSGRPTAWVCRRFACRAPVTDPAALAAELREADHQA
jgi:uncharacterized protein YyaL (SSP411 family)